MAWVMMPWVRSMASTPQLAGHTVEEICVATLEGEEVLCEQEIFAQTALVLGIKVFVLHERAKLVHHVDEVGLSRIELREDRAKHGENVRPYKPTDKHHQREDYVLYKVLRGDRRDATKDGHDGHVDRDGVQPVDAIVLHAIVLDPRLLKCSAAVS